VTEASDSTRGWAEKIRRELAPTHGRFEGALRTASAATIATAILLTLQLPMIAPGIYLIFLVSYDVPYLTFRRSLMELATQCLGVAAALALIQITGNDPMARVLGIAAFTFLSAFLLQACTARIVAMNIGIFPVLTLSLWEYHLPSKLLVYLSAAPIAAGAVAVGCKVVIEYLFTHRDPRRALNLEIAARLTAMHTLFTLYCEDTTNDELAPAITQVSRFAFAGQSKMLSLLKEVESAPEREDSEAQILPATIPMLAWLLDLAAAFGERNLDGIEAAKRAQARRIAAGLDAIELEGSELETVETDRLDAWEAREDQESGQDSELLERFLQGLYNLGEITRNAKMRRQKHVHTSAVEKARDPWFKPDAWTNPEYLRFATKLSLCATLCYVLYNAFSWPGISTATLTVLVAGLSTSGTTNQKMLFRIVGALIGGVIFGIGCIVFVYPFADSLLPFLLSVGLVSFVAAWTARSAHLGYIGLQIAFSFYLTAFQEYAIPQGKPGEHAHINLAHKFAAPVILTIGRDRVLGVLLALVVMWAIFHRVHSERAIEKMQRSLAQLLRTVAELLPLFGQGATERVAVLRDDTEAMVVEMRGLAEAIPYELDHHVERDLKRSETIQNAISSAGSLLLHAAAQRPHSEEAAPPLPAAGLCIGELSEGLRRIAARMEERNSGFEDSATAPMDSSLLSIGSAAPKSARPVLEAYSILCSQCRAIYADSLE